MLNRMTLNRLHEMKLRAMAEKYRTIAASAAEGQLSFDEWFGLLVDAEWDHRHTNRIARLMKKATLYFPNASVEDIEYRSDRKLMLESPAGVGYLPVHLGQAQCDPHGRHRRWKNVYCLRSRYGCLQKSVHSEIYPAAGSAQ